MAKTRTGNDHVFTIMDFVSFQTFRFFKFMKAQYFYASTTSKHWKYLVIANETVVNY